MDKQSNCLRNKNQLGTTKWIHISKQSCLITHNTTLIDTEETFDEY